MLDFIEHPTGFFHHVGCRRVGRLDVDGQPPVSGMEPRRTVVVAVELEKESAFFVDFNAAARHPYLFAKQVAALRLSVHHNIHLPTVRCPCKRGAARELEGEHVAHQTVVHEIGEQCPPLARSHAEKGVSSVETDGVRLFRFGKGGVSPTLHIHVV